MEKRIFIIIYFLFVSFNLLGQNELKFVTIDKEYKDTKSSLDEFEKYYFKLIDLKNSTYKLHMRFLMDNRKIFDLYSNDRINFDGQIVSYVTQQDKVTDQNGKKIEIPNKYVYGITKLDTETSNKIGRKILDLNLMGSDSKPCEHDYAFGKMYFTMKSDLKISERSFMGPLCDVAQDFYNFIDNDLNFSEKFHEFTNQLEKGKFYTYDSIDFYKSTDEEHNRWKKDECISITHIGASDKPLLAIIISKDSVANFVAIDFANGKSNQYYDGQNYIVDKKTYSKLKTLIVNYKKNRKYDEKKEYEFFIYAKGNPNHKYFLNYKESMNLLKLLIKTSKTEPNTTSITDAFERAVAYYENF